jgi:hypothetical protein
VNDMAVSHTAGNMIQKATYRPAAFEKKPP